MTKILILGTGFGQLPLINACKEMDIESVGVDRNSSSVGAGLVDKFYEVDIINYAEICNVAKQEGIDGAVTMQTDASVPTLGKVNDELGLTGVTEQTALACSNKNLTRELFKSGKVSQPNYAFVTTLNEAKDLVEAIGFPCVIKAPDSSGSRGVTKLESIDALDYGFQEAKLYSGSGLIIIEEFIKGIEIGAQTFSEAGECLYCFLHNDTLSEGEYMVPVGHSYPLNTPSINEDRVKNEIFKALNALGLKNGPANIDLIVSEDGTPYIIEIGARAGATCLPELTSFHTGYDWTKTIIRNCLGLKHEKIDSAERPCAALILQSPRDGVFRGFDTEFTETNYADCLIDFEVTASPGDLVSILRKGTDRIGKVITSGNTPFEAEKKAAEIAAKIVFEVD
ncbi:ATP-grasp domain-containing protein [Luminiphilus sp.]|nr:ATP-grasp domain-containing protein [Luminiphilus sp.]